MVHGRGASKNSSTLVNLEKIFSEKGMDTIRFDVYGHGDAEGSLEKTTISAGVSNLLAIYKYLKSNGYMEFGLVGVSFGGEISILAAHQMDLLKVLTLKAPALDYVEKEKAEWGSEGIEKWRQDGFVLKDGKRLNYSFYEDALKFDFEAEARKITVPTLIIAAEKDEKIPMAQTQRFAKAINGAELVVIPGATHIFPNKEDHDNANKLMSEFILKNLT